MECPFCAKEFNDNALVCKSCGRDLRLVRPLIEENALLIQRLEQLQLQVNRLRASLSRSVSPVKYWLSHLGSYLIAPIALLLLVHFVITIVLNGAPIYVRLSSLAIPLPFGLALIFVSHHGIRWAIVYGLAVGILAVLGMLTVVGFVDNVPILPADKREWRETAEYVASIMLAYVTGHILGSLLQRMLPRTLEATTAPNPMAIKLARLMWGHVGEQALRRRAQKISDNIGTIGTGLGAIGAAGGSLYAGIRALLE